jgi:hypothetical protein
MKGDAPLWRAKIAIMSNFVKNGLVLFLFAAATAASCVAQENFGALASAACDIAKQQDCAPSTADSGLAQQKLDGLVAADGSAQEKPDSPKPKVDPPSSADKPATDKPTLDPNTGIQNTAPQRDENTKRIAGIIPNFQSRDDIPENRHPMTPREKYILALHESVDISAHFGNAFQAVLQQADNGQPHYGQGWGAYASRFGALEADQVTWSFFTFGFLPHVLHDDPRYWRKRYGSPWSRIKYAASRTVVTYTDDRRNTFNVPEVLGQLLQQGISTSYYPPVDRSVGAVFNNWGINLAYNSAYNVLKEFYPDFLRIVFHRHTAAQDVPPPAPEAKN